MAAAIMMRCRAAAAVVVVLLLVLLHGVKGKVQYDEDDMMSAARRRPWNILDSGLSIAGLDYYVQVEIGGLDLGVLIEAINTTATNNFGHTELFAFNVTEGADPESTQLGFIYGYTVQASYTTDARGVEVEILDYNDGTLNGTVSIQGLILNAPNEVAIVGGTGDFRGASGYGLVTQVNSSGSIVLYHHELTFL